MVIRHFRIPFFLLSCARHPPFTSKEVCHRVVMENMDIKSCFVLHFKWSFGH